MRKLQIGVIGSMADIKLENSLREIAKELGREIAKNDSILVFGFEGDFESLSTIAAEEAEKIGGQTLAFMWGVNKPAFGRLNSVEVVTGQHRGGGREFSLILSCDAVVCISGGSGTLMEITMAYQARIPIIAISTSGGWSKRLSNTFLDERKAVKIEEAKTPKEAITKLMVLIKKKRV